MHVQIHLMTGWCTANFLPRLSARQRLFCMIAACVPDLDGLSIVGDLIGKPDWYGIWHHRACHNLPFGILACLALTCLSRRSIGEFLIYLGEFHLHLIMDIFGSGPKWGIFYLWPFSDYYFDNTPYSWDFYSWQNITIAAALLAWTIGIAYWLRRTPLELIWPKLDRDLVKLLPERTAA